MENQLIHLLDERKRLDKENRGLRDHFTKAEERVTVHFITISKISCSSLFLLHLPFVDGTIVKEPTSIYLQQNSLQNVIRIEQMKYNYSWCIFHKC